MHIVGTRPNFVKAAAVYHALQETGIRQLLVHTGQHNDFTMSASFFQELDLPKPDAMLECQSSLDLAQFISKVFDGISAFCKQYSPKLAVVYGDVNSTLAAALACDKLKIPIAHVEAGLRSFDSSMQEEFNRLEVDRLSSWLFTTERSANDNLIAEGFPSQKIFFVGNCMIDTLQRHLPAAFEAKPWEDYGLHPSNYLLCTLHRPNNVDNYDLLAFITTLLTELNKILPVLFPIHPRTKKQLASSGIVLNDSTICCEPLVYNKFIGIAGKAKVVLTDSGGVQEETTWLNIPCLTLRPNTERPVTIEKGTNKLVAYSVDEIMSHVSAIYQGITKKTKTIEKWDGHAGERISKIITKFHHDINKF